VTLRRLSGSIRIALIDAGYKDVDIVLWTQTVEKTVL